MRTFMTFLACTGFIVWAHTRDTKILGVQPGPSTPGSLSAKQAPVNPTGQQYIKGQYVRELMSATALTIVDKAPASYFVSTRHKRYLNHRTDSLLLRFRPQQVLHQ